MQAACDVAYHYAHQRDAFGSKIGKFQVIFYIITTATFWEFWKSLRWIIFGDVRTQCRWFSADTG